MYTIGFIMMKEELCYKFVNNTWRNKVTISVLKHMLFCNKIKNGCHKWNWLVVGKETAGTVDVFKFLVPTNTW